MTMFSGVTGAHMNKTTPLHVVSLTWTWSVPSFSTPPSAIQYSVQPFHNLLRFHGYWSFHFPLSRLTLFQPAGICSYSNSKLRVSFTPMKCCVYLSVDRDNLWYACTRVGTLIVETIYLQLIQNRYMFRSFTVLQCTHQHCLQPVASDVEVVEYI